MKSKRKPHATNGKHVAAKSSPSHEYPRPQLARSHWRTLNGTWEFAIDAEAAWSTPDDFEAQTTIIVPFAPETPRSGVENTGFFKAVWYRRTFETPAPGAGG